MSNLSSSCKVVILFRRDAMKNPVKVASIKKVDMKKQPSLIS